jgi:hypothetical protein
VAEAALDAAAVDRLSVENKVLTNTQGKEVKLLESYIDRQAKELKEAKKTSLWDRHGNAIMLGAGVAAGILMSLAVFKTAAKIAANTEASK